MANDAFVVHGMVMLKPQVPTEKVGETMFWKRKKDGAEEGNPCPFCGAQNELDATTCVQCYYDLNKPARDQHLEVASDVQNDLLSTLMNSDDNEDEEEFAVEAVLDLEDVTIEVDQYDDPLSSDGFSFIDSEGPTLSETVEFETREEVELTTEDAPDIEERFELPDANPLDEVEEPVHTGQGQLIQTADDENDIDFTGTVGPDPNAIPELPETDEDLSLLQENSQFLTSQMILKKMNHRFQIYQWKRLFQSCRKNLKHQNSPKTMQFLNCLKTMMSKRQSSSLQRKTLLPLKCQRVRASGHGLLENQWILEKCIESLLSRLGWSEQDALLKQNTTSMHSVLALVTMFPCCTISDSFCNKLDEPNISIGCLKWHDVSIQTMRT